jgi:hypothetical protein
MAASAQPPLPPKVSQKQAERFRESLRKGQPHRDEIWKNVQRDRVREMV